VLPDADAPIRFWAASALSDKFLSTATIHDVECLPESTRQEVLTALVNLLVPVRGDAMPESLCALVVTDRATVRQLAKAIAAAAHMGRFRAVDRACASGGVAGADPILGPLLDHVFARLRQCAVECAQYQQQLQQQQWHSSPQYRSLAVALAAGVEIVRAVADVAGMQGLQALGDDAAAGGRVTLAPANPVGSAMPFQTPPPAQSRRAASAAVAAHVLGEIHARALPTLNLLTELIMPVPPADHGSLPPLGPAVLALQRRLQPSPDAALSLAAPHLTHSVLEALAAWRDLVPPHTAGIGRLSLHVPLLVPAMIALIEQAPLASTADLAADVLAAAIAAASAIVSSSGLLSSPSVPRAYRSKRSFQQHVVCTPGSDNSSVFVDDDDDEEDDDDVGFGNSKDLNASFVAAKALDGVNGDLMGPHERVLVEPTLFALSSRIVESVRCQCLAWFKDHCGIAIAQGGSGTQTNTERPVWLTLRDHTNPNHLNAYLSPLAQSIANALCRVASCIIESFSQWVSKREMDTPVECNNPAATSSLGFPLLQSYADSPFVQHVARAALEGSVEALAQLLSHNATALTAQAHDIPANTIADVPPTVGVLLGAAFLQLCCISGAFKCAQYASAAFAAIQYLPVKDRHPFFRKAAYRAFLRVLCLQLMHPSEQVRGSSGSIVQTRSGYFMPPMEAEPFEFLSFRRDHAHDSDALNDALLLLQGDFVDELIDFVRGGILKSQEEAYRRLEVAMFCLTSVKESVLEMLQDEDIGLASNSSISEVVVGFLLAGCKMLMDAGGISRRVFMGSELAVTCALFISSLSSWLDTLTSSANIRCADLSAATANALYGFQLRTPLQNLDTSFIVLSASGFLQTVTQFLMFVLGQTDATTWFAGEQQEATLRELVWAVDVTSASNSFFKPHNPSSAADDSCSEDDEENAAAIKNLFADHDGHPAVAAIHALSIICRRCRQISSDSVFLKAVADALHATAAAKIPVSARLELLHGLLVAASHLSAIQRAVIIPYLLEPSLRNLRSTAAALLAVPSSALPTVSGRSRASSDSACAPTELAFVKELAFLLKVLQPAVLQFDDADRDNGQMSGESIPANPVDNLVSEAWSIVEPLVPVLHACAPVLIVVLAFFRRCLRVGSPRSVLHRVPNLLSVLLNLFDAFAYPDVLWLCREAIDCLPMNDSNLSLPYSKMIMACQNVLQSVSRRMIAGVSSKPLTAVNGPQQQLQPVPSTWLRNNDDVATEYLRLLATVARACPDAFTGLNEVICLAVRYVGLSMLLTSRDAAHAAVDFLRYLTAQLHATAHKALDPAVAAQVTGAFSQEGLWVLFNILEAILPIDGPEPEPILTPVYIDALQILLTTFHDHGVVDALASALGAWHHRLSAAGAIAGNTSMVAQSGPGCLTSDDIRSLATLFVQYALHGPRRKFRQLFDDLSKVCSGLDTKNVFALYAARLEGGSNSGEPTMDSPRGVRQSHGPVVCEVE
jgi:hypothetical protein